MRDKEMLRVMKYIELEEKVDKLIGNSKFIETVSFDFTDREDLKYLCFALKIPFSEIKEALDYYDSFDDLNKPNELEFIEELKKKFNVSEKELFKRIKQVRKIDFFKNGKIKKRCRIKSELLKLFDKNNNDN